MNSEIQKVRFKEGAKREKLKKEKPAVYEKVIKYVDKVRRGESIALIVLNYDYTCNFSCRHCCAESFKAKSQAGAARVAERCLTPDTVREICRQGDALGLANIVISGGEPLTYKDFDKVVEAIDPRRWYIAFDTNGWFLDEEKARHVKSIGVDKVQISLDSIDPEAHDRFRNQPGSYARVMRAIDASLAAGLQVILLTTAWKERVWTDEFIRFLEFSQSRGIGTYVTYAKPVGVWEGNLDVLCGNEELKHIEELEKKYELFTRLTPGYGIDLGCISVKRSITITKFGDVMPCPYIYVSLGNIFDETLKDILARGLRIKHFAYGEKHTCLAGNKDYSFIETYMTKMFGKKGAVSYKEVFTAVDFIDGVVR
ncbi:MAG: radical SAM/SPASM domain-containing protein [Candidatus Velamenicoccus archaeovorus]